MMKYISYCIAAAAAVMLALCGCSGEAIPASVLLDDAHAKALAGNWAMADTLAQKVLSDDKNNVDALLIKALAQNNLGNEKEALDCALHASELRKDLFLCQYIKGMLLYKNGKYDLALAPLQEARKLRPSDTNTLVLLAKCCSILKKYNGGADAFARIASHGNFRRNPLVWNGIGVCMAHSDPRKALSFLRMAERLSPGYALTSLNTAVLYDRYLRNRNQAVTFYERFLASSAGHLEMDAVRAAVELRLDTLKNR